MVRICAVETCKSKFVPGNGLTFHALPRSNSNNYATWIEALSTLQQKEFFVPKSGRICSLHFTIADYYISPVDHKRRIRADAVPSIGPGIVDLPRVEVPLKSNIEQDVKRIRLDHNYADVTALEAVIANSKQQLIRTKSKIKALQRGMRRMKKKIDSMSSLIQTLRDKSLLDDEASNVIKTNFSGTVRDLLQSQVRNSGSTPSGRRYTEEVKKFAQTLHFYSPRAYEYVRTVLTLPCSRSISNWSSSVNAEPGFFIDVFKHLGEKALTDPFVRDCALIVDGMSIKAATLFNKVTGKYDGFVDYGPDLIVDDADEIATEALVFMLVGLRGHWKYPIGYVLCDKITSVNLASLISQALNLAALHNLNVVTLTCDGAPSNFEAMRKLGCKTGNLLKNISSSFKHPTTSAAVHFIPDPCHMLKLARNALADVGTLYDSEKRPIKWEHISKLHEIQANEGMKFANKLSSHHIQFERHKMNVRLAAQTLSSSVADAIEFLKTSKVPEYSDSEGTIIFIRTMDLIFDLLNSKSPFGKGFKQPLSLTDKARWQGFLHAVITYLLGLTDETGLALIKHRRRTFVIGLILCCMSIDSVASKLLARSDHPFNYLLTYKMSQDHLETLFACIRGKNGFNNNPNVVQLKSSLRRILIKNAISGSRHANCTMLDSNSVGSLFPFKSIRRHETPLLEISDSHITDSLADTLFSQLESFDLSEYQEAIIGYIAGYIVRKIRSAIGCTECAESLVDLESSSSSIVKEHPYIPILMPAHLQLIVAKNRGGLVVPSTSVVRVVTASGKAFRLIVCQSNLSDGACQISSRPHVNKLLLVAINRSLTDVDLFPTLRSHDIEHCDIASNDLHSNQLKKQIIKNYLTLRLTTYGKHYTQSVIQNSKSGIRQQANKLVLFQNL